MFIRYVHIYVDGKKVRNWRFFKDIKALPNCGEEITFSNPKWDIRYKVISHHVTFQPDPDNPYYVLHCEDLSKELYGPWRRKTEAGWFHEMDPVIMKMYPEYSKKDFVNEVS